MPRGKRCRSVSVLSLVLLLAGGAAARAQTGPAHLVKDINTAPARSSSFPSRFVEFKGLAYFQAGSVATGTEL